MAADISNQNLWQILIGHSALRDPDSIRAVLSLCVDRLLSGLAYYEEPSPASEAKLKSSDAVKGKKREFVLEISKHLHLDQLLSFELFQCFLRDAYRGSLNDLNSKLSSTLERQKLLRQVQEYYHSERLYSLRCLKHLLGYWQDPSHPYREVYASCLEEMNKDDESILIKGIWRQYEQRAVADAPPTLQTSQDEIAWLLQNLREQCELLETVLLYYKDFVHPAPELLKTAKLFQALGFGLRQHCRVGVVPSAEPLVSHIGHLCSLILVEVMDLDWVYINQDVPDQLSEHHLLKAESSSSFKELDNLVSEWGDNPCHAPVLLAWTVFKFIALPRTDIEHTRLVGNRALQADVFPFLLYLLRSPYFHGDRPVASISKAVVHTLLSLVVTSFNEESLGDPMTLVAIATETLTHPRLRLEFWEKDPTSGAGLLLASSMTRFPLELTPTLTLLQPLSTDPLSAHYLFQYLSNAPYFTEPFSPHDLGAYMDLGEEEGTWVLIRPRTLFAEEGRRLGCHGITLPVGTRGVQTVVGERQAICWECGYSAWELFALETCSILHCQGIGVDPTPHPIIARVTEIAQLVTQMLKHNWPLASHLQSITSQYFSMIQKFSPLPNPPSHLLATCLECIAMMAKHNSQDVWKLLSQTGFLPYQRSSSSQVDRIVVAPGHYGQLLNVWERPRGIYPVSMAMLELLLTIIPPSDSLATTDQLACVVFVMREMFAGCHKWRYRSSAQRDEMGHKLLQLCHSVLESPEEDISNVRPFVSHFLLHMVGGQAILNTLSVGVDTVNRLYSCSHSTSHPVLLVESLKFTFSIIDLLLQSKTDQVPTPLEQALATQSAKRPSDGSTIAVSSPIHLVAVIASYIHHHEDPHLPAGATRLLTRLSQVAPMSVFACLGQDAVSIRDAYVKRLEANVEDTELKVAILELISESIISQPGLMELFLCVKTSGKGASVTGKAKKEVVSYVMEPESCLHIVLDMIDPDKQAPAPSLHCAAVSLMRSLWQGRHDAALVALHSQPDFWKHLTNPLFNELQLEEVEEAESEDAVYELLVCSHVMHIVAMETYYVVRNRMDQDLISVIKEFASSGRYKTWTECLKSLSSREAITSDSSPSPVNPRLSEAQYQLAQAWRTLLLVAASCQESVFQLSDSSVRTDILNDLLQALESQLTAPPTRRTVAMTTELSMLYMILLKKWASNVKLSGAIVSQFTHILQSAGRLDPSHTSQLYTHIYSTLIQLIRTLRNNREPLEPRFTSGLVPSVAETLQNHHTYLGVESRNRPDTVAVYLLMEVVHTLPDIATWLHALRQYSIVTMLTRMLDEHLRLKTDEEFIEAILSFFLSLARYLNGAESLLVNEVSNPLCISMADALATKLKPPVWEKQHNGAGVLQLRAQTPQIWYHIWHITLKLSSMLLTSLGHQFISHSLDFTAIYQERMIGALDIFECVRDLQSLEETRSVCHFLQHLAHYKQQWKFALPVLHDNMVERIVYLASSAVAILSNRSTLKHIVKTMHAAGVLPPEYGPCVLGRGRLQSLSGSTSLSEVDGAWVVSSPAFAVLQDSLVSILTFCLATLKCYTPSIVDMITEGVPDLSEYPILFSLSLTPPTVDCTTPPSLATLTSCLSTGLALMNKLDPHRAGTPSKSPSKSPGQLRTLVSLQKRAEYLCLLEHSVILLLSQAVCYLTNPSIDTHDKQVLKKELANELGSFSQGLLLNFTRKGAPSPGASMRTPTPGLLDSSSGKTSSLSFSDTAEQGIFRLADSFAKQFFR